MKQKKIYLIGTGGGMMDDIQMMAMSFYAYREVDLKTARELLVSVVDEYLADINGNEEIQPYLHDHPFTAKNVEIRLWFFKPDGSGVSLDTVQHSSAINGELDYFMKTHEKFSSVATCEETYEEALYRLKEPESSGETR